ncbi:response regulator [Archangium sp.]|uniref:response regulator n=1 Tax=Archangium sp. TaxID=1872627 RepID=UPI002D6507E2|nr:response regulator [Archangium sp.]HYO54784.1 response regulator [Archangium sp.]
MNPTGSILLVNDEPAFLETYRTILATEGYSVDAVTDGPSALAKLEQPRWDLVLLDRKLQGRYGPDTGLDLIQSIRQRAPEAKVILVTGVADSDSVNRAFAAGAYDYLEKNAYFEAILKVKVRHALEAARERRMAALANGKREETIRELWHGVRTERDPSIKGALLEDLVALLFKSIPGFERTQTNRKSLDEEIDIVIPNESTDPFWLQAHSQYILGECKNWSKSVERKELDVFLKKIERRYGRCRLGFFISIGGFAKGFESGLAAERAGEVLVVALDAARLDELVQARDRNAKLKELHARALMASAKDSE